MLVASACLLAACGGGTAGTPAAAGLTAREYLDAREAVEKFLSAERTREAVIVARKLVEKAPEGSEFAARANEVASRALFTHARLPTSGLAPDEREALLREAALCAIRSIEPGGRDAAAIGFAALLAAGAGMHDDAVRLFDEALAIEPENPAFLMHATLAALRAGGGVEGHGGIDRARAYVARRRAADPASAWNDGLDAEIALAAKDPPAAVRLADRAMAAERGMLEFRLIAARALRADGRAADAARMLSALEDAERAKPAIAEQFALALAESGDAPGAARAWSECLRANPADAFVRAECAIAHHRAGDSARAAAEMELLRAMPAAGAHLSRAEAALREKTAHREETAAPR